MGQPQPLADLAHHARVVVAMSRATPGLVSWTWAHNSLQIQLTSSVAGNRGPVRSLPGLQPATRARPVIAHHPQLITWGRQDTNAWIDFESGTDYWTASPSRIGLTDNQHATAQA